MVRGLEALEAEEPSLNPHSESNIHHKWHLKTEAETLAELKTSVRSGLDHEEVLRRRASFGVNVLETAKRKGRVRFFLSGPKKS
jgi:magnesium-transporting ATPase (P-type)